MPSIEGFILAGGKSRRMGTDKSRLTIAGETFVEIIAKQLSGVTRSISVVGAATDHAATPPVLDIYPEWGALGGVHASLAASSAEWALIVACDFPFVSSELFQTLVDSCEAFDAVAPVQADGIPQPLCSLYRVEPCLSTANQLIKSGERRPIALLQSVNTRWLQFEEIAALENALRFFDNINTPEDYARLTHEGS